MQIPTDHHYYAIGDWVVFTEFARLHNVGLPGKWQVADEEKAQPSNGATVVIHPQIVTLGEYPIGKVSGFWIEPASMPMPQPLNGQ